MVVSRHTPPQMQAAAESAAAAPPPLAERPRPQKPRSRMMRQYDLVERVRSYNPDTDEDLLNRAYVYAMKAHGSQTRASGDPYFTHPLEVAAILTDLKLDDATIVAALLHDTIEDTEATRGEIDRFFGPEIGALVEGLTKLKRLELVSREAKQAENLRKLLLAIADDVRVLLVKLADRLHNMRTLEFVPEASRRRIAEETLDIYAPLSGRMGMQEMREELEDLSFRTLDPQAYSVVMQRLDALAERNRNLIGEIESQLARKFRDHGLTARVFGRRKRPFSIWTKMERKSIGFRATVRHLRLPRHHAGPRILLPGARHRAYDLAGRSWTLQGLHLDAQAERLSLDTHNCDRPRQATRRAADSDRGHGSDRRASASPPTPSTRTTSARRRSGSSASRTRSPGCATPSASSRRAPIQRNSSSTPSSSCFTIRCSASRRRES